MHFTSSILALGALASAANAVEYFYVSNFYCKHATESPYVLTSFDVSYGPNGNKSTCFATEPSAPLSSIHSVQDNPTGLTNFTYGYPCKGHKVDIVWSLKQASPSARWDFFIGEYDSGGDYFFPANAVSTFVVPTGFGTTNQTLSQLTAPGGKFRVRDINS